VNTRLLLLAAVWPHRAQGHRPSYTPLNPCSAPPHRSHHSPRPPEYSASEGQRERRLLLSELRNLVPPSHAALLAPALLNSGLVALDPGGGGGSGGGGGGGGGGGARERERVVRERAARAARAAVLRQYPSLPPALLLEAVQRLADGGGSGSSSGVGVSPPAALGAAGADAAGEAAPPGAADGGSNGVAGGGSGGTDADAAHRAAAWCEVLLRPSIAAAQQAAAARCRAQRAVKARGA
jgi:hypothetical protein